MLQLLATGRSNADIAADLYVSVATVRKHLEHAYRKLGVHSRMAAVIASGAARHRVGRARRAGRRNTPDGEYRARPRIASLGRTTLHDRQACAMTSLRRTLVALSASTLLAPLLLIGTSAPATTQPAALRIRPDQGATRPPSPGSASPVRTIYTEAGLAPPLGALYLSFTSTRRVRRRARRARATAGSRRPRRSPGPPTTSSTHYFPASRASARCRPRAVACPRSPTGAQGRPRGRHRSRCRPGDDRLPGRRRTR